jgi:hypothetical protein
MKATITHVAGGMRQRFLAQATPHEGAGPTGLTSGHPTEQSASDRGLVASSTPKRLE